MELGEYNANKSTLKGVIWYSLLLYRLLTKSELLYCLVLLSGILKPQELLISCLTMMLLESQSLKVVAQILLLFLSAGIRKFSGGIAVMWD